MLKQSDPGLQCPQCGSFIHVSLNQLLAMQPLACPKCDTVLRMDENMSRKGLEALKVLKEVTDARFGDMAKGRSRRGYDVTTVRKG